MEDKPVPKTRRPRRRAGSQNGSATLITFTGASGGHHYVVDGEVALRVGDTGTVPRTGHWAALVASGDAEVAGE